MPAAVRPTLPHQAAARHQRGNLYALWPASVVMANMICFRCRAL